VKKKGKKKKTKAKISLIENVSEVLEHGKKEEE
jgi:hypothetical protein